MFYEVRSDASALLRAMKEHHGHHDPDVQFSDGTRLAPYLAAEGAGLDPETPRYERAVRYLVREGALVWEERAGTVPGVDFYRVTRSCLELLEETWRHPSIRQGRDEGVRLPSLTPSALLAT